DRIATGTQYIESDVRRERRIGHDHRVRCRDGFALERERPRGRYAERFGQRFGALRRRAGGDAETGEQDDLAHGTPEPMMNREPGPGAVSINRVRCRRAPAPPRVDDTARTGLTSDVRTSGECK